MKLPVEGPAMKWFISMRKLGHGDEMTSIGDEKPSILQGYLGISLQCLQYDFCIWEILEILVQEDLLNQSWNRTMLMAMTC